MEQEDGVRPEDRGHDHREAGEVPLHNVRAALRGRGEAHAAEAGLATRMHEDQRHEEGGEENLEDR
jgi:hypothetical protein